MLGSFKPTDRILTIQQTGEIELKSFDLSNRFNESMILISKNNPQKPVSAIYFDGHKKAYYVKRFLVQNTISSFNFITNHKDSRVEIISTDWRPQAQLIFTKEKGKERRTEVINIEEFIAIKGEKALGNKLTSRKVKEINLLDSLPYEEGIINKQEIQLKQERNQEDNVKIYKDIELEINNEIDADSEIANEDSDDEFSDGQITLEL